MFLDVIESLNLLVSSTGNVLRSEILGAVKLKCYLSGMPELRLGLNDKVMFETTGRATRGKAVEMEDVKFHQCVRLSRFENDRTISFIPPDGEFELMSYRLNTQVKPLIWVESDVRMHSNSRMEYTLKVRVSFISTSSQTFYSHTLPLVPCLPNLSTDNPPSIHLCSYNPDLHQMPQPPQPKQSLFNPPYSHCFKKGPCPIQTPLHSQQRRNSRPRPRRRRLPPLPHKHRFRPLRPRKIRHCLENQAVWRRQGIPHARRIKPTIRKGGR